jgi:hypothetical protein
MSRYVQAAIVASLMLCLSACGETPNAVGPPGTPAPAPTRTPGSSPVVAGAFTPPPGKIYFGAYVNPSGLAHGWSPADVAQFEAQLGRTLTLHQEYFSFTANFSGNLMTDDYTHFRVPIVSWNCEFSNAQIASGAEDGAIIQAAQSAKNFSGPIFLRYLWEPNVPATEFSRISCWDPKGGDLPNDVFSPTQFIAAWQHIHTIFNQVGATNVVWLWSVSADPGAANAMAYYPGNQWVDWVGIDSYDLSGGSPATTYSPMYSTLSALNKPIMISETGAPQSDQATFFPSVVPTLQSQFPLIKGWVYYDAINYNGADNQDWRIATSAWSSFISLANDPYMSATYAP